MATAAIDGLATRERAIRWRFVATIFAGSFLLFLVQPMIARMALPRLGGAPSVWNSAMLVYQALLLAGYSYAHLLDRLRPRAQAAVHLGAFALAGLMLPIGLIAATPPADANPFVWVPWLLLVSIGPLFFVISAQAPLMQRWFTLSGGGDPYPLYAASNLGSFAGLIAYPLLVEPLVPVGGQRWLWTAGYCLVAALVAWCALAQPRSAPSERPDAQSSPRPGWRTFAYWALLASIPSGLILSTTLHLTTDIVAMPLLWVVPLAAYLLSFSVAFAVNRRAAEVIANLAPLTLLFATFGLFLEAKWLTIIFALAAVLNLFAVSVALHSQLFNRRPESRHLTFFYLAMSVGGVLGGIFCALVAPLVFNWTYEHLILLVGAAFLITAKGPFERLAELWNGDALARRLTLVGILVVGLLAIAGKGPFGLPASPLVAYFASLAILGVAIAAIGNRALFMASLAALMVCCGAWEKLELSASPGKLTRSFFGIYTIRSANASSNGAARMLAHGTTLHGIQNLGSPARERMATTYYATRSGVGLAMAAVPELFGDSARVDVVGLGAGTLACYAQPGQRWTFYEIDPVVVRIGRNQFSFLSRCLPSAPTIIGDARLTLEHSPAASADVLVVDAFSSDSIPMHLLTREAFAAYRRHLSPRGLLLVHISNRYLDLQPVIAAAASAGGWQARVRTYYPAKAQRADNETPSQWIALSPSSATLDRLIANSGDEWRPVPSRPGFTPWTDDYSSLLPLIRWSS